MLDLSLDKFVAARDKIVVAMRDEMKALRLRLENVAYGPDREYLKALENLREDCDGAGHQHCMQSLKLIREGKIAELKHNS